MNIFNDALKNKKNQPCTTFSFDGSKPNFVIANGTLY